MADNKNKNLQQLQIIKERMISAGISEEEADTLIAPLEGELMRRVCCLVWQHTASSIPDMEGKIPALIPVPDKNIVSNTERSNNHILIEGENLLALMAMQYTHIDENGKGMIDVIYIDPPYNTGSVSFAYNDKFEKSEWLSMMDIRLKLARNLLKDDGVIFISIDDDYYPYIKLLCDDIFLSTHFVSNLIWKKKTGASDAKGLATITENVLVYCKADKSTFNSIFTQNKNAHDIKRYRYTDEYATERGAYYPDNLDRGGLSYSESLNYGIVCPDGTITFPNGRTEYTNEGWTWKWSREKVEWGIKHGFIEFKKSTLKESGWGVYYKNYLFVDNEGKQRVKSAPYKNVIDFVMNQQGTADLKKSLGRENAFSNPKPVKLIEYLLSLIDKPDAVIIDFFAGSGTTGHAVLDLNKEDGGRRQFILCTNNELGKEAKKQAKKNGYEEGTEEYESFGVCHAVTYPRMQNIFPDYPGNNLYFYRIQDTIEESSIDDVTAANMASRAVFYVAMKENAFNAEQYGSYFKLSGNGKEVVVVTDPDMDLYDVRDEILPGAFTGSDRRVYCSVSSESIKDGITYVPYPDEVMKVLKATKKYIRREVG